MTLAVPCMDGVFVRHKLFNLSLPAVETSAHSQPAGGGRSTAAGGRRLRRSSRATPVPPTTNDVTVSPSATPPPSASPPCDAHANAKPRVACCPEAAYVKMEVCSDNEEPSAAAAVVANDSDYSSCNPDDASSIGSDWQYQSAKPFVDTATNAADPAPASTQQTIVFEKDDDAACDDLLMDILSGDGEHNGDDDEFLSLLADDIVDPSCDPLESMNGFVKEELEF